MIFKTETEEGNTGNGIYYISRDLVEDVDIPTQAVCAIKVLGSDSNKFKLSKNNKVTIVAAFSSNFKNENCLNHVINRISNLDIKDIETIESKHLDWWKNYWSKSYVNINDSLIEKQYYLSNYNLASLSRDKDFPPSIFGTCITKERPYWNGDYHLNYNHLAPFYSLFSSNHIEQAIPCNIPILEQQERGEYYSEKVYGIKGGILLPVGIQHIYPGGQIGLDSNPELLQVAHNTIDVMQRWIDICGSNSFFPAAVHVGYNADTILTKLHKYCNNTYPNGLQLNNPHGIENLSTVPNTINEMLCMGYDGILRLFPVWPKKNDASFHNLRIRGAFLISSELKDEQIKYVEVLSEKGRELVLVNPWNKNVLVTRPGNKKEVLHGKKLKIKTSIGEKILIEPKSVVSGSDI